MSRHRCCGNGVLGAEQLVDDLVSHAHWPADSHSAPHYSGDALEELWDKTGAKECSVIVPEWAVSDRLRVLTLAFETFGVTRIAVTSKASFALLAAGRITDWSNTGIVVHSGNSQTVATAVYEGMEVMFPTGTSPAASAGC